MIIIVVSLIIVKKTVVVIYYTYIHTVICYMKKWNWTPSPLSSLFFILYHLEEEEEKPGTVSGSGLGP